MTIYVDESKLPYRGTLYCHMMVGNADDLQELHDFAKRLGLRREWFQDKTTHPHYDLAPSKRALAIKHGAVAVTSTELIKHCMRRKMPDGWGLQPVVVQAEPCTCNKSHKAMVYTPQTNSHNLYCGNCGRDAYGATIDELLANWSEANQC